MPSIHPRERIVMKTKTYKISQASYILPERDHLPSILIKLKKPFHVQIYTDGKRTAFLTRDTEKEAKSIGEEYCNV